MATGQAIGGTVYIRAADLTVVVSDSVTASVLNTEREGQVGAAGVAGYTEKPRIPYIEVGIFITSETDVEKLNAITSATITAECNNGWTYHLYEAWHAGSIDEDLVGSKATVRFEGRHGKRVKR